MEQKSVFILGSINMDLVISIDSLPKLGETKIGHDFFENQGGKGANQAVATSKLGVKNTYMIGQVGNDSNGKKLLKELSNYGVNCSGVNLDLNTNSGVAIISFDESKKDNVIIIDKGANNTLNPLKVKDFLIKNAKPGDILISQFEINLDALYEGFKTAKELKMYTILNPAPCVKFDKELYKYVDLIIPNETECELLTSLKPNESNFRKIYEILNVNELIITLGSKGGVYINKEKIMNSPVYKVDVVDTTSAGDTYIGALAYKLSNGCNIEESLDFAAKCSSITVSRRGASKSIPTLDEVNKIFNS